MKTKDNKLVHQVGNSMATGNSRWIILRMKHANNYLKYRSMGHTLRRYRNCPNESSLRRKSCTTFPLRKGRSSHSTLESRKPILLRKCCRGTALWKRWINSSGAWRTASFKPYNFNAMGVPPNAGALHPLMKMREEFRNIFFEMGYIQLQLK